MHRIQLRDREKKNFALSYFCYQQIRDVSLHNEGHIERLEGELPSFTWTSRRNELMIIATQLSSDIASVRLHGTYYAAEQPTQGEHK